MTTAASVSVAAPRAPDRDGGSFARHGAWSPGVQLFRHLRFGAKALIVSLAFTVPAVTLLVWLLINQSHEAMQARLNATRQVVEVAITLLHAAHAEEVAGTVTREEAQRRAKSQLVKLRYDGQQYFFTFDMHPRMLVHPFKPELVGQDISEFKDPNGIALFSRMVALVRKDGKGFVAHQWAKPGQSDPVDKISYAQGFEPWGWVIASGVYVDDLRAADIRRSAWAGGIFLAALLVPGYLFLSFYRVMEGGFAETQRHLRALTAGDLTTSPQPHGSDEAADLLHGITAMQKSLRSIVSSVRGSSEAIVNASTEISSASSELSSRTEATSASVEESAASMEEISATVKNTADNVQQAARLAADNSDAAARGGAVIAEVVRTMEDINHSSKKIGDIIGVIDGIAFQTNILALNAAVEAARAGEQGRGFAVVATEVRSLAQRSAQAAREIKSLISASVGKVEAGFKVVKGTGETMQELVVNAEKMNGLLRVIAAAALEQSAGVSQVGSAVAELDRMTQQNATLVEETAGAAATLKCQAAGLKQEVDRFKLP